MRTLVKWHPNRNRTGEYRRSDGFYWKRAKIIVDGKEGGFYGAGNTFEEADAALRSFLDPKCVCFPGVSNVCEVHPDVKLYEYKSPSFDIPSLECHFKTFDPEYKRWPTSGEKEDGAVDMEVLDEYGYCS